MLDVPPVVLAVVDACRAARRACPFGARETVMQSIIEAEARARALATKREVVCALVHDGARLGNGALHRHDLVVSDRAYDVVVEVKCGKRVEPRDVQQLCRYLHADRAAAAEAHGVVVAFGDAHDEAWYVRLDAAGAHRARLMLEPVVTPAMHVHDEWGVRSAV